MNLFIRLNELSPFQIIRTRMTTILKGGGLQHAYSLGNIETSARVSLIYLKSVEKKNKIQIIFSLSTAW